VTFLLAIPLDVIRQRVINRAGGKDRFDQMDERLHQAVIDGYRRLASENPGRVVTLDGSLSPGEIHRRILREIQIRQANPLAPANPDV
jgi:thymidylate kinase